jgi:enoyl-CoA hydratase/carnithine racemase
MSTVTETPVLPDRRGAGLWLRLNRPRARNALNPELIAALHDGLDRAEHDPEVRCVVIAGAGPAFCAGADLDHIRSLDADARHAYLVADGAMFNRIEAFPKPVIAAVHGAAIAGGLELALCADFIVAADTAVFGDGHANYGLIPAGGGSVRLPRRIGAARARYMMFTGEVILAPELAHTDLLAAIVPAERLDAEVERIAARLSAHSPLGLAAMKRLVADGLEAPAAVGLRQELQAIREHGRSADFAEGMAAFDEHRAPRFTGR